MGHKKMASIACALHGSRIVEVQRLQGSWSLESGYHTWEETFEEGLGKT
jgi:hypothetical protein